MYIGNKKKEGYWQAHSASWKKSRLSQKQYCEQAGISYASFVYQHTRMSKKAANTGLKFIESKPVKPKDIDSVARLQLMLPNGIGIGVEGGLSSELLERVLRVASRLLC